MNENEFTELLQFLQSTANQRGFGALNDRIIEQIRGEALPSAERLDRYLTAFIQELEFGSEGPPREALLRLREVATSDRGQPIDGVRVELSASGRELFDVEEIDLLVTPDRSQLIGELRDLRTDLRESREEEL